MARRNIRGKIKNLIGNPRHALINTIIVVLLSRSYFVPNSVALELQQIGSEPRDLTHRFITGQKGQSGPKAPADFREIVADPEERFRLRLRLRFRLR